MHTNFKIISLTRLEIKPESSAPEADALTIRPESVSELNSMSQLNTRSLFIKSTMATNMLSKLCTESFFTFGKGNQGS